MEGKFVPIFAPKSTGSDLHDMPLVRYERDVLRSYAAAAFHPSRFGKTNPYSEEEMVGWYRRNRRILRSGIAAADKAVAEQDAASGKKTSATFHPPKEAVPVGEAVPSKFQKRLEWLAGIMRLDEAETAFLGVVARTTRIPVFQKMKNAALGGNDKEIDGAGAAWMAGIGARDSRRLTNLRSRMFELGLLVDKGGGDVGVSATVVRVLWQNAVDDASLRAVLLGGTVPSTLDIADFRHLGDAADYAQAVLAGALETREKGVGILFHGAPGTGKTEFARLLGTRLDAHVVFVGEETGEEGERPEEPTRADRLSHLSLASVLAEQTGRVVLVVDEADDVFTGVDSGESSNRTGSKVFVNRLVETCPVPIVWITNHADRLGPAVLRRMLFAVRFREPDAATRLRIVERHAKTEGVVLDAGDAEGLAALAASPAVLGSGIRAARIAGAGRVAPGVMASASTRSILQAAGREIRPAHDFGEALFDPALSNADCDLSELERSVVEAGPGPLSFLFSGLSGTGKSAFARRLAASLGLEVLQKRGSDLLDMYVGGTEKKIAASFEEAADTGRFLIFDEAEALLLDRAGAQRSWEVGQVSEMLTWMERHPLPFAATTNLVDRMDPATGRRFLFKVGFLPLETLQIEACFRTMFGMEPPASVGRLHPLTPGDLAVVARKAKILRTTDPVRIAQMVEAEVGGKSGGGRRVGF